MGLRYFNAAGADPEAEVGELREKKHTSYHWPLMPPDRVKHLRYLETSTHTDDGTCVRDYVHVMDLADAHLKSLNYASQNPVSEVFNLGSGEPASNNNCLIPCRNMQATMNIEMHDNRPGDPAYLVADTSKAKEILDWEPTQSSIDNVVSTAVQWYNKTHKKEIQ